MNKPVFESERVMRENKTKDGNVKWFAGIFVILTGVMILRAFFGIEITDEAYYLAEARTVYEGNLPFVLNNSGCVGMTLTMIPFVWLYQVLFHGYEGYFLYMRLAFSLLKTAVLINCFFCLRKKIHSLTAAYIIFFMLAFHFSSINNFSYNSISELFVFWAGTNLLSLQNERTNTNVKGGYFFAGFISAIAVFAHPVHSISVMIFLLALIGCRTGIKNIILFIMGGLTQIVIFLGGILIQTDWKRLAQGIYEYLNGFTGGSRPGFFQTVKTIGKEFAVLWILMACTYIIGIILFQVFCKRNRRLCENWTDEKKNNIQKQTLYAAMLSLVFGLVYVLIFVSSQNAIIFIGGCTFFTIVILFLRFPAEKAFLFLGFPFLCFCFLEAFLTASNSPEVRFAHLVPALSVLFIIFDRFYSEKRTVEKDTVQNDNRIRVLIQKGYFISAVSVILLVLCELNGLRYVYRDDSLEKLNCRVESGIYQGIFTTEKKARDTIGLEEYIKSITNQDEMIAFRDNVPVGYLLMNGKACDIRTWDCLQYSYGENNPLPLYSYYERRGSIPDKIIYVDFGRDDHLSLYDDSFSYNDFISENYKMISRTKLNETYKEVVLFEKIQK